jgi:hypothetical protein
MKPDTPPVQPAEPKVPENFEPFDEDYSMDAEEEQESVRQEGCDDFDTEEGKEGSSTPKQRT